MQAADETSERVISWLGFGFGECDLSFTCANFNGRIGDAVAGSLYMRSYPKSNEYPLDLIPLLAEGAPEITNGGKTYTIKLKDNLKFSNGNLLKAVDIVFSYNVYLTPNINTMRNNGDLGYNNFVRVLPSNSSIIEIDELTIQFNFPSENYFNNYLLLWAIFERAALVDTYNSCNEGNIDDCDWTNPDGRFLVSAGPYMLDKIDLEGLIVELVKNPYFHESEVWTDRIKFIGIPDNNDGNWERVFQTMFTETNPDIVNVFPQFRSFVSQYDYKNVELIPPGLDQELSLNLLHPYFGTGELIPDVTAISSNDKV